jgi:hypothetical protein
MTAERLGTLMPEGASRQRSKQQILCQFLVLIIISVFLSDWIIFIASATN